MPIGFGILLLLFSHSFAQTGTPFITNFPETSYASDAYVSSPQNWDFVQDEAGLLYVANTSGILEYDGKQWRQVSGSSDKKYLLDLARDSTGQLYAGGRNELGLLEADSSGRLQFRSLLDSLPPTMREFGQIQSVLATDDGVYFIAPNHVFQWTGSAFRYWLSKDKLSRGFYVNGQLLIQESRQGLVQPVGDRLKLVAGGSAFGQIEIRAIVALSPGISDLVLISKSQGLFRWNAVGLAAVESAFGQAFPNVQILDAIQLNEQEVALAAYGYGIIVINRKGQVVTRIRQQDGLLDNQVIALRKDNEQGIWAGLGVGISRVSYPFPLTKFGEKQRLKGVVNSIALHRGTLYAGSTNGLYILPPGGDRQVFDTLADANVRLGIFDIIPGAANRDEVLLAAPTGTFQYVSGKVRKITSERTNRLYRATRWPDRVFLVLDKGLEVIRQDGNTWRSEGRIRGLDMRIEGMGEAPDGSLWIAHGEVSRLSFPEGDFTLAPVFTSVPIAFLDLSAVPLLEVYRLDDRLGFGSTAGLFLFDPTTDSIRPDTSLLRLPPDTEVRAVYQLTRDIRGTLWFDNGKQRWRCLPDEQGGYQLAHRVLMPLEGQQVWDLYTDRQGIVWAGTTEGLYRYDPEKEMDTLRAFHALIRRVSLPGDSTVFFGHDALSGKVAGLPGQQAASRFTFPYGHSDLQFEFAATTYSFPEKGTFSYLLEGYDRHWSPWKTGNPVERYTNLREGDYRFRVKARNVYGQISEEGVFVFRILPPWYRSWWAQLITALMALGGALAVFRYATYLQERKSLRQQRLLEEKLEQERRVSEQLQQLDKLKDEFLANTSHELRTPLNGIIGIAEGIADGPQALENESLQQNLNMIIASGKRLSNLVNDLLDFSQLKTRNLDLRLKPVDLHALTNIVLHICRTLISGKNLDLRNEIPRGLVPVEADEERLEQVLLNLVSNAIKFTETGSVTVSAEQSGDFVSISVSDTGIGIPPEKQAIIFESFEQGDGSVAREYGGTGLGLSITRQLVQLHGGTIAVTSEPGKGSRFQFELPISSAAPVVTAPLEKRISHVQDLAPVLVPEQQEWSQHPAQEGAIHILIVDDEPINQQVLRNHLADEQYHLVSALNGEEALLALKKNPHFDLVLLDIMMPRMSGYEVCEQIRRKYLPSELPIIMITAKNQVKDLVEGFSYGANDYLAKPFSKVEFLARVKMHLNLHSINKATARFVPYEFLRSLGKDSILDVRLGDQAQKNVTVMFIDIRSYTTLSEQMTPEDNFRFLNTYLGKIGPIISDNRGFVNQYFGDGIMALFLDQPEDAIIAAINIRLRLMQYNQERQASGRIPIATGIGIHSGPLILGVLGDQLHMDTGVVADAVNTASRMEGLTKIFGSPMIVSQDSIDQLREPGQYNFRFLGNVQVKGKREAIGVYEFFDGEAEHTVQIKVETLGRFEAAIGYYFAKDFEQAARAFQEVLAANPKDRPARYYADQTRRYLQEGVPETWTGVEMMGSK